MAGRGPQSFKKRQKEQQRKEKQQEKSAKRLERRQRRNSSTEPEVSAGDAIPSVEGMESTNSA